MRIFDRFKQTQQAPEKPPGPAAEPAPKVSPDSPQRVSGDTGPPDAGRIRVSRTLVKSEPELTELVASHPRLAREEIRVELAEKGFGTRVELSSDQALGIEEGELETLLDELGEPQKRPFSTG